MILMLLTLENEFQVGFVPNNNHYCLAQTLAVYCSLFRAVEGEGSECPYPGSSECWVAQFNNSSQDMVARFSIYASLNPKLTGGHSINVADNDKPSSWSEIWPVICQWFKLRGVGPREDSVPPAEYLKLHKTKWSDLVAEHKLAKDVLEVESGPSKGGFQYHIMTELDFDRQLDLELCRKSGFLDRVEMHRSWWHTFERLRQARRIP